jgi:hypothetical protein
MPVNQFDKGLARTPKQTYVDQHVKMPFAEMMTLMDRRQKASDLGHQIEEKAAGFLDMKVLRKDKELMNQKSTDFTNRMDEIVKSADGDYSKVGSKLTAVAKDIRKDMTSGQMAAMSGNLATYQATGKELSERLKDGKITNGSYMASMNEANANYEGVQAETNDLGNYNTWGSRNVVDYQDVGEYTDKIAKGFESNANEVGNFKSTPDGKYLQYTTTGWEEVPFADVAKYTAGMIEQNKPLMESMKQEAFAAGQGSEAYENDPAGFTQNYVNSAITEAANNMGNKYGYRKTNSDTKLKADPYSLVDYKNNIETPVPVLSTDITRINTMPGTENIDQFDKLVNGGSQEIINEQFSDVAKTFFPDLTTEQGAWQAVQEHYIGSSIKDSMTPEAFAEYEAAKAVTTDEGFFGLRALAKDAGLITDEQKAGIDAARKLVAQVESQASDQFALDLASGTAGNALMGAGGMQVTAVKQMEMLQSINSKKRAKRELDNLNEQMDLTAKYGTRYSDDPKEMLKMVTEDNKSEFGITKGGTYEINGTNGEEGGAAYNGKISGADLNNITMAIRTAGDSGQSWGGIGTAGKEGEFGGWKAEMVDGGEGSSFWSGVGKTAGQVMHGGAGKQERAIWKMTDPSGLIFYTTEEASGKEVNSVFNRRDTKQTDKVTNANYTKLRNQVFAKQHIQNVRSNATTSYGKVSFKDNQGVVHTVDTDQSARALDHFMIGGKKRTSATGISLGDASSGMFSNYDWSKAGAEDGGNGMGLESMIVQALDEAGESDTPKNREKVMKQTKLSFPLFDPNNGRNGQKPAIFMSYKIQSTYPSLNGVWSMDTKNVKGHDFGQTESSSVMIANAQLRSVAPGQKIVNPLTNDDDDIGYRKLDGSWVMYYDKPDGSKGEMVGSKEQILGNLKNFVMKAKKAKLY